MRAVVQRVRSARVRVGDRTVGAIERGLLVFVGVEKGDSATDLTYIASKIRDLRIFEDHEGKMNLAASDARGGVLVVSQFTLCGDCRKGRRPSFDDAEAPAVAQPLYERLVDQVRQMSLNVQTGEFQAQMLVELVNDGPVTILLDSRRRW
jgi:D-aminoacyl-tRNA deacylase